MTKIVKEFLPAHRGVIVALSAATLLSACVVQERVYRPPPPPPPPPRVYAPPPPPAYDAPAAEVEVQASQPPPPLPDYDQPPCPEDGYLWTPGYWHWTGSDYYWIPGTWVQPPRVGVLWTPGYWGFVGGFYGWHAGYWGPHVGFYGGVNYGFGYVGVGFAGGRWAGNSFAYNTAVNNVNTTVIHNTYNTTVVNNVTVNKVSYNGGSGGVAAAPTAQERAAAQEQHVPPTPLQRQHVQEAVRNPALAARANGGHRSRRPIPRGSLRPRSTSRRRAARPRRGEFDRLWCGYGASTARSLGTGGDGFARRPCGIANARQPAHIAAGSACRGRSDHG